jgi:hypothetical protein
MCIKSQQAASCGKTRFHISAESGPMAYHYNPRYTSENCPPLEHWDLDIKITVFSDRVTTWALDIAQGLVQSNRNAGFAGLSIILSYFEMICLYEKGNKAPWTSRNCFYTGVESVSNYSGWPREELPRLQSQLYTGFRCWLYHQGMVSPHVGVTPDSLKHKAYEFREHRLIINPLELVNAVQDHFTAYVERLRAHQGTEEFLAQFDRSFRGNMRYPGFRGLWQWGRSWTKRLLRSLKMLRAWRDRKAMCSD